MTAALPEGILPKVVGHEFKHACYSANYETMEDLLVVKEYTHYSDGTYRPTMRLVKNFPVDFYVTKKGFRNHKDKKEWEEIKKLDKFTTTKVKMPGAVARALGQSPFGANMRQLARSQYLYNTDISSSSLLKRSYQKKYPDLLTPTSTVAVFDTETTPDAKKELICATLSMKETVFLCVHKEFVAEFKNPEELTQAMFEKYLSKYKTERNITLTVKVCDTRAQCLVEVFKKAHELKPDFIAIWNMIFDLEQVMKKTLAAEGLRMEDVLSDPIVPPEYRRYVFTEGPQYQIADSGKKKLLLPAERWHVVDCTASFYFIDAMCLYKRLRTADGNEKGYGLDEVLRRNLKGVEKLKIPGVNAIKGKWHSIMQKFHKIEYLVYNTFDCISMELLDEKTGDISRAFQAQCDISDYGRFKSNPKRIVDDLHFYCMEEEGLAVAAYSDTVHDELEKYVTDKKDYIVTLPAHLMDDVGLRAIKELPNIVTGIYTHVADLDFEGTYPNIQVILNISKETTWREMAAIKGLDRMQLKLLGINLTGGEVNAIEICIEVLQLPSPKEMLGYYREQKKAA